ncbi:MAG TPA: NAD kinase [Bacteroidetes bacterium]|nr:NAD kinase [Bacteroidota bacterium]
MKNVLIYGNHIKKSYYKYLNILLEKLEKENIKVFIYKDFYDLTYSGLKSNNGYDVLSTTEELLNRSIDTVISFGGDGTILNSTVLVKNSNVPILGINLGRLGFLAIVEKNKIIEAIDMMQVGNYEIQKRGLLKLDSSPSIFEGENFALNDFTIHKSEAPSVIAVHTYMDSKYLNTYWADGLIVSTPTGSTGYSLSCGGPIVFPGSGNFIITPVAPHNLTMRPIVVPDDSRLSFEIESRSNTFLCTLDSRYEKITSDFKLEITKADFEINIVVFEGYDFSKNLQNKLNWGNDKRN